MTDEAVCTCCVPSTDDKICQQCDASRGFLLARCSAPLMRSVPTIYEQRTKNRGVVEAGHSWTGSMGKGVA